MGKHGSVCATLVVLGMYPLMAQQQEGTLQQVELPGPVSTSCSPQPNSQLQHSISATGHLIGGELALGFEDPSKMLEAIVAARF